MKELAATARNTYIVVGNTPRPMTELILILSEPLYRADMDGSLNKERVLSTLRVHCNTATLRALAKECVEAASELDAVTAKEAVPA